MDCDREDHMWPVQRKTLPQNGYVVGTVTLTTASSAPELRLQIELPRKLHLMGREPGCAPGRLLTPEPYTPNTQVKLSTSSKELKALSFFHNRLPLKPMSQSGRV